MPGQSWDNKNKYRLLDDLETFQAFCTLLMCDDPTVLSPKDRDRLEKWANRQAVEFGFNNWIEVYVLELTSFYEK